MRRIYVAGPIGAVEGRSIRCAAGIATGCDLVRLGFSPLVQHFYTARDAAMHELVDYETWLEVDTAWLDVADAVLRIPGESPGADHEVTRARGRGIPVFFTIGDLLAHARREGWSLGRAA